MVAFISDLKKQKDRLYELITKFRRKEQLNIQDLHFYDITTTQIVKRLRTLRQLICEEVSKSIQSKNASE